MSCFSSAYECGRFGVSARASSLPHPHLRWKCLPFVIFRCVIALNILHVVSFCFKVSWSGCGPFGMSVAGPLHWKYLALVYAEAAGIIASFVVVARSDLVYFLYFSFLALPRVPRHWMHLPFVLSKTPRHTWYILPWLCLLPDRVNLLQFICMALKTTPADVSMSRYVSPYYRILTLLPPQIHWPLRAALQAHARTVYDKKKSRQNVGQTSNQHSLIMQLS